MVKVIMLSVVVLKVIMLSVVMLSVIMLSVVAPHCLPSYTKYLMLPLKVIKNSSP